MKLILTYASNVFQNTAILDPKKSEYVTLPTLYLDWFEKGSSSIQWKNTNAVKNWLFKHYSISKKIKM